MAHEILKNDTVTSTTREWHRKEQLIPEGLSPREGVKRALPWETEMIPVQGILPVADGGEPILIGAPDFRMHIRTDDRSVLSILGKDYKPVPNQVIADFADALVGADGSIKVETCGSLRGGKRVFMCAKVSDIVVAGEDILKSYLTITNCHDGTGAFRVYFLTTRIVCMNTFRMSESRAGNAGFWFRHDGDVIAKIEEARKVLGIAAKVSEEAQRDAQLLNSIWLRKDQIDSYFAQVYDATFGKRPETDDPFGGAAIEEKVGQYDEKRELVMASLKANHENDPAEGTAWGAFNAVTEYHDHQRGRGKPQERTLSDARMHSNLFGASALDKQKAHDIIHKIVA